MNTTYTQKNDTVQKVANTNAESVKDSSTQNDSLQRKADMANGTTQLFPMSDNFSKHHDGRGKDSTMRKSISDERSCKKNSFLEQSEFDRIDQLEPKESGEKIVVEHVPVETYEKNVANPVKDNTSVLIKKDGSDDSRKYFHLGEINEVDYKKYDISAL